MENPGLGQSQQCGVSQGIVLVVVEFYPQLKFFFPLFLCAVMDGNEVCVKNVFLNKVQSVIKYPFASLSRPDGRLGLIVSVFQSFCSGFVSINIDHMTTFSFQFSITVQSLGQWIKNCHHFHKRDQAIQLNIKFLSSCNIT